MEKLRILLANALAGILDLCVGAAIAATALRLAGAQIAPWHLAVGALLAVLPDLDILWPILSGQEAKGDHHLTLMHRPLLIIPAASLLMYALGGTAWEIIAFLCVTWHYLHDTPLFGSNGVAWLWPIYSGGVHPHGPDVSHHKWLKENWMTLSPRLCMELGAGLVALSLALYIATF